ncbi:hypothetical protein HMPREF3120_05335 [Corynebacterium sp. HMSC11D10]|uniref:hypothetical protein n=1 Tax=Corynebacterium sp. HMSC11D10 TaxID=1581088 RepID=UPI0008A2AE21|nr:hypothetical protein [Corynebacterium sp. HMSC11D10]OFU54845.1 hypothetical protein HMPREF3120_05335 [Corynebacterium sp. HMSC11D10]
MISELAEVDVLKMALDAVREVVGNDTWVADRLPDADNLTDNLPAVVIDLLPGEETTPWGGRASPSLLDAVPLDVEVVARSRGEATRVAVVVRQALHQLPYLEGTGVKQVDCPRLSTREDINPYVKVLGVVADLTVAHT